MTNLKLVTSALLCIFLFSGSSCEKEKDNKDTLPPETHEGLNTFGCMVNQELFRESGTLSFGLSNPSAQLRDNVLSVDASQAIPDGQKIISFGIKNFNGTGKYNTLIGYSIKKFKSDGNVDSFCEYRSDSTDNTVFVNITYFDPIKKIVSGNFSVNVNFYYSAYPNTCDSSSYRITDGLFDLTFYKWN